MTEFIEFCDSRIRWWRRALWIDRGLVLFYGGMGGWFINGDDFVWAATYLGLAVTYYVLCLRRNARTVAVIEQWRECALRAQHDPRNYEYWIDQMAKL